MLVPGPDLDRLVRVLGRFLRDNRGQPFSKAALSSGVAEAGWRGRGFCTDQPIAFRASQPRCGATRASPSSEAIQAATVGLVHSPHRAAAHASDPGACSAGQVSNRMGVCRCGAAGRPEPADPGRCSGPGDAQPIAGHTTPWLRPRRCGALWPEARAPEGAAPRSHPCTSDTAAPAPIRSDDRLHAPWLASVTHDT